MYIEERVIMLDWSSRLTGNSLGAWVFFSYLKYCLKFVTLDFFDEHALHVHIFLFLYRICNYLSSESDLTGYI